MQQRSQSVEITRVTGALCARCSTGSPRCGRQVPGCSGLCRKERGPGGGAVVSRPVQATLRVWTMPALRLPGDGKLRGGGHCSRSSRRSREDTTYPVMGFSTIWGSGWVAVIAGREAFPWPEALVCRRREALFSWGRWTQMPGGGIQLSRDRAGSPGRSGRERPGTARLTASFTQELLVSTGH